MSKAQWLLGFSLMGACIPILVTTVSALLWLDPTMGLYLAKIGDVVEIPLLFLWPSRIMLLPLRRSSGLIATASEIAISTIVNVIWFLVLGALGWGLMRKWHALALHLRHRRKQ